MTTLPDHVIEQLTGKQLKLMTKLSTILNKSEIEILNIDIDSLIERMIDKYEKEQKERDSLRRDLRHIAESFDGRTIPSMNFQTYQEMSKRTMPGKNNETISNYALGLAGEAGETVDMIKKVLFHHHLMNKLELKKELGDVLHYVSGLATLYDLTLEDIATTNIVKLQKRYPNGFSAKASKEREEYQ